MKNIAIIPARSGSKGLKDKNIKLLGGKPLIAYSIEAALESQCFDEVMVSTDSDEYAKIAREYGACVPFLRSNEMSSDQASSWDAAREVIECYEKKGMFYDRIALLQPTTPLRSSEDIKNAFELMEEKKANAIISVTEVEHSPLWCSTLKDNLCMDGFYRRKYMEMPRQMLPTYYRENGAIYLVGRREFNKQKMFRNKCFAYVMSGEKSIDIDTKLDFKIVECMIDDKRDENE